MRDALLVSILLLPFYFAGLWLWIEKVYPDPVPGTEMPAGSSGKTEEASPVLDPGGVSRRSDRELLRSLK